MTATLDEARAFVEQLASRGERRVRPAYIAENTAVDPREAHALLAAMADAGELDAHFEVICPNDECHRTAARLERVDEIPIGSTLECPSGHSFEVSFSNVWVYYTPSRELLLRLNREGAAEPGNAQKKASKIRRALRALATSWLPAGAKEMRGRDRS